MKNRSCLKVQWSPQSALSSLLTVLRRIQLFWSKQNNFQTFSSKEVQKDEHGKLINHLLSMYIVPEKFIVCLCDYFDDIIMNCHKNTVNVRPNWPLVLLLSSSFLSTIVSRNRGLIKGLDLLENGRNVTFCIFYKVPLPSPA